MATLTWFRVRLEFGFSVSPRPLNSKPAKRLGKCREELALAPFKGPFKGSSKGFFKGSSKGFFKGSSKGFFKGSSKGFFKGFLGR